MMNKLSIRNRVATLKNEYTKSSDPLLLLEIAILKGAYIALGGAKAIPLPSKYNNIIIYSNIIFTFKIKTVNKNYSEQKLIEIWFKILNKYNKHVYMLNDDFLPVCDKKLASIATTFILASNEEDLVINRNNLESIYMVLLKQI